MPDIGNGKERKQEPVQVAPIPPYEYSTVPAKWPMPGTPQQERIRGPEVPKRRHQGPHREYVPVSESPHTPTPARTRPFLPYRSAAEYAPVSIVHEVQAESPLTHSRQPGSESIQQPPTNSHSQPPAKKDSQKPDRTIRTIRSNHLNESGG